MKKNYDVNSVYLLHINELCFYVPLLPEEVSLVNYNTTFSLDYYVVALKTKNGVYRDLNGFRKYKEKGTFELGSISCIAEVFPILQAINNDDLLNNPEIHQLFSGYVVNEKVLIKSNKRGM